MPLRITASLLLLAAAASAQVPPGPPYVAGKHPNPIVTFVDDADFEEVTYEEARDRAGFELLGLSIAEGERTEVAVTESRVEEVRILGRKVEALFYPVVRQRFTLTSGRPFTLYSFRNPRSEASAEALNQHAWTKQDSPEEQRFGPGAPPRELDVRGTTGLLFAGDRERSLFWQESGQSHVASAPVNVETLVRLVEDLL